MKTIISTNPARNFEVMGEIPISSEEEIHQRVLGARLALRDWNSLGVEGRIAALKAFPEHVERKKEELARLITLEMGMPIGPRADRTN